MSSVSWHTSLQLLRKVLHTFNNGFLQQGSSDLLQCILQLAHAADVEGIYVQDIAILFCGVILLCITRGRQLHSRRCHVINNFFFLGGEGALESSSPIEVCACGYDIMYLANRSIVSTCGVTATAAARQTTSTRWQHTLSYLAARRCTCRRPLTTSRPTSARSPVVARRPFTPVLPPWPLLLLLLLMVILAGITMTMMTMNRRRPLPPCFIRHRPRPAPVHLSTCELLC